MLWSPGTADAVRPAPRSADAAGCLEATDGSHESNTISSQASTSMSHCMSHCFICLTIVNTTKNWCLRKHFWAVPNLTIKSRIICPADCSGMAAGGICQKLSRWLIVHISDCFTSWYARTYIHSTLVRVHCTKVPRALSSQLKNVTLASLYTKHVTRLKWLLLRRISKNSNYCRLRVPRWGPPSRIQIRKQSWEKGKK